MLAFTSPGGDHEIGDLLGSLGFGTARGRARRACCEFGLRGGKGANARLAGGKASFVPIERALSSGGARPGAASLADSAALKITSSTSV